MSLFQLSYSKQKSIIRAMLSHPFRSGQPFNDGSSSCPKKAPGTGKNGLTDFFSALDTSRPHHQTNRMVLKRLVGSPSHGELYDDDPLRDWCGRDDRVPTTDWWLWIYTSLKCSRPILQIGHLKSSASASASTT